MSTEKDPIELTEADYVVVPDGSPEREKELADQGIILNYRPKSVTAVSMIGTPDDYRSDNDRVLAHYQTGRAKHHLDTLLVPMIRHSVSHQNDVIGSVATQYTITAVRGAMVEELQVN